MDGLQRNTTRPNMLVDDAFHDLNELRNGAGDLTQAESRLESLLDELRAHDYALGEALHTAQGAHVVYHVQTEITEDPVVTHPATDIHHSTQLPAHSGEHSSSEHRVSPTHGGET